MKKEIELDPQLKESFDEDGYVAIRGFLDADEVAEMNANLDRYIRDVLPGLDSTEVFCEDKDRPETLMRLNRMYEHDAFFDSAVSKGKFKDKDVQDKKTNLLFFGNYHKMTLAK